MKSAFTRLATSLFLIAIAQPAAALTLDFSGFQHGAVVTNSQGVQITTVNLGGGPNLGVAFNTNRSNTADDDLERGRGWSRGNLAPNTDLGIALIIQENRQGCTRTFCNRPDDEGSRPAGTFTFDFRGLGSFRNFSMDVIDIESETAEPGSVRFYRNGGQVAHASFMSFLSDPTVVYGNHSANRILNIVSGIEFDRAVIRMGGSGAIDNVTVTNPVPEPASALLFGLGIALAGRGIRRSSSH